MVTVSVVGLDRAGPVVVLRVTAEGLEKVTAEELVTVAAPDIVIVVPVLDTMVVPATMPGPLMTWPATSPARLDTAVSTALPAVVMPVGVAMLETVAFADRVTVAVPRNVIVVPAGMPAPVRVCPMTNPPKAPVGVTILLPATVIAVNVKAVVSALLAVAATDIVIELVPVPVTVAPAGMPVPEIGCPTIIPVRLDTDVMVALPLVRTPVGLTTLEAVPLADMVMVVPLAAVIVVGGVVGMPVPVIGCPTNTPLKLDTFVMTALPEVTMPVGLTVTETVAFCEIVMVLVPTTVM
jgi:hypothetical protein